MTDVITVDSRNPDPAAIARAAARLRAGGLVAFPTETVYGLGAHALDPRAVLRIFEAKQRPSTDPLIVHVAGVEDLVGLVAGRTGPDSGAALSRHVAMLAERFWPGPLTLVLPRAAAVPDEVTAGLDTVGVRVPAHAVARALIAAAGVPIAAPSANLFSRPSPTTAAHVLEDLRDRIDLVVDAGPTMVGVESTVLDLSGEAPLLLRPGAVTREMLLEVLPRVDLFTRSADQSGAMPSPGLLDRHYSPRAPLTLYEGDGICQRMLDDAAAAIAAGQTVGIVAADDDEIGIGHIVRIGRLDRPDLVAVHLYAALRELDAAGVGLILARQFPSDDGLGRAVRDRLRRAAAGRVVSC